MRGNGVFMRLLIIYGQNALGRRLMLRLTKEDHYVVCIDKTINGLDKRYAVKEISLEFAESLQEAFRIDNFDGVIYLGDSIIDYASSHTNGEVLEKVILLCGEYNVERFMYVGQNNYELSSELKARKAIDECICNQYVDIFKGSFKVVFFDNIYGEEMGCGLLLRILRAAQSDADCPIKQGAELVYIDDAVDLLWRAWNDVGEKRNFVFKCSEFVSDMESLYESIRLILNGEAEKAQVEVHNSNYSDGEFIAELQWKPKYRLNSQLPQIVRAYCKNDDEKIETVSKNWRKELQPYTENIVLFVILVFVSHYFQDGRSVNNITHLDFSYVYIMVMGLLYGKTQAAVAVFLSTLFLITRYLNYGADMVGIFYRAEPMIHMATYMFLGTAVGYVTDSKNKKMADYVQQISNFKRRFNFLYKNYLETVSLKDTFYKQVLNNDNSLGRTAYILQQLESVRRNQLYVMACNVVCEFLGVDNAALYTIGRNGYYLRLRVRKGEMCNHISQSLKIEDFSYLINVVKDKHLFINKGLQKDVPDMAAPILYGDKTIAVIQLYGVPFEKFTAQSEIMLKVVSLLIASAVKKAIMFEELLREKMYLPDTRIMRNEYFLERLSEAQKQEAVNASSFRKAELIAMDGVSIAELVHQGDYKELWKRLDRVIREEDVVGITENDRIEVLFFDLPEAFVTGVTDRLGKEGVEIKWLEKSVI